VPHSLSRIDLVEASFEKIKQHKKEFSTAFYHRLFTAHPELQPLFSRVDINRQGEKLYAALVLLVENLRHPAELERVLLPLGEKHIGYGATPEAFPKVGGSIVATLSEFLGDDWTPELNSAWSETLEAVTETMLRGAGMHIPAPAKESLPCSKDQTLSVSSDAVVELVQKSFASIRLDKDAFTEAFYQELFKRGPQLQPLFGQVDIRKQGVKLQATLALLVENLRKPQELEKILGPLGRKHVGYGANAENYPLVGEALLATMQRFLGEDWTPPVALAWSETLESVQAIMLQGAEPQRSDVAMARQPATAQRDQSTTVERSKLAWKGPKSDASVSRRQGLAHRFAQWFYSASLSTIVTVWVLIGASLVSLSFAFPDIRGIVIFANPLSLLLALFLYIRETPERKKQFHYHAWSIIDNAAQVKTSNARFLALQDLCADGVSLSGLRLEGVDLKNVNLPGANLSSATLRGCNLAGGNFGNADLNNTDLRKADLSGAQIDGANLGFAKLSGANCSSADLRGANLMFADLSDANLSGVNLEDAKLSGAVLKGTYLSGANLRGTDIGVADLESAFLVGAIMPDGSKGV
jgi:hemoglobin-like flavoprotein/uncharacterized protein YjbI with pentapeptide repeats